MQPGNNNQNVPLALSIIHETTNAASKSYLPKRADVAKFLTSSTLGGPFRTPSTDLRQMFLGMLLSLKTKTEFYRVLDDWIEQLCDSPAFKLTVQTKSALVSTLRAQAILIDELLVDGYQFVRAAQLQSDPIERRFSQYRQMNGGRFLVSLREVINSERILKCQSLNKVDIDMW